MSANNHYQDTLEKNAANHAALTPIGFIERAARVYPNHVAVIHGPRRYSWSESFERSLKLASALRRAGVAPGDTVGVLAPNVPAIFDAHFGVPMCGAVLNTINTRLDAETVAYILDHAETRVLLTDTQLAPLVESALRKARVKPLIVDILDHEVTDGRRLGEIDYESFIAAGGAEEGWQAPADEWDAISLNYTSGTTGKPKGVVYHHRGAYLNSLSNAIGWNMSHHPVYLWTLPMFHCNGWCFPWTLAALAGTSVCLRKVDAGAIFDAIASHRVTHFCGAPVVLNMVINAPASCRRDFSHRIEVMTAAAPPPASVMAAMEQQGFSMTHVYGLTETYGPAVMCAWHADWDHLDDEARATLKARQGVAYHVLDRLEVINPDSMQPVAADGETMGEVMFRGNIVMKGYFKDPEATRDAFAGGWFHSGDLGVMCEDHYLQLKDRSKDIIISGGENISSIEVENVLYSHPEIVEAAVVARSDEKWGESPCAFVTLSPGSAVTEREIIDHCREKLAHYKCPRTIIFSDLPKTSTGKVQKFLLRRRAQDLGNLHQGNPD